MRLSPNVRKVKDIYLHSIEVLSTQFTYSKFNDDVISPKISTIEKVTKVVEKYLKKICYLKNED
jgi:hypothetical protein